MDLAMFEQILQIAFDKRVSDAHFEVDNPPFFRVRGQLVRAKMQALTAAGSDGNRVPVKGKYVVVWEHGDDGVWRLHRDSGLSL